MTLSENRRTPRKRQLTAERLEDRRLLASDSGAFFGFGSLTASIAPDNTRIGFRTSHLHAAFDASFGQDQWQPVLERALQTWAREAEINLGMVDDNGAPAGIYGPSRGDSRFGDIRFFGASLGNDVWAEAISENARGAGTWAGDVIFNIDAPWRGLSDLETVALHEFGHILGLKHSPDPNSPMHAHRPSNILELTETDIAILQSLHGPREADPAEDQHGNDTIKDASRLKGNERDADLSNDDFRGDQIWLQFGDLLEANDQDVFEIHMHDSYSGPLAVSVRTEGLSLAKLKAEILDRDENVLATAAVDQLFGGQAQMHMDQVVAGERYFVRIRSTDDEFWTQGDYAVVVGSPANLSLEASELEQWANNMHRWFFESRGTQRGFSYDLRNAGNDGFSDDDGHLDDEPQHARVLPAGRTSQARTIYTTVGSVSDTLDVDYLRFSTPESLAHGSKLLVDLQSLELNKLVPEIQLLDQAYQPLQSKLLSVGFGTTLVLVENISADTEYFIRLDASGLDAARRTGNYSLNLELSPSVKSNEILVSSQLSSQSAQLDRTLYLAIPQVMTFSLEADVPFENYQGIAQAVLQLFDDQGQQIHNLVAPIGKMRSLPGLLLDAGQYFIQLSVVGLSDATDPIGIELSGTSPSDPIGPLIAPVDTEPIYTCDTAGDFCYPDGTESPFPSHVGPGPIVPLPPIPPAPIVPPPDEFFWDNDLVFATNSVESRDTNGDGQISPLDVLLVINYLNSFGSGTFPEVFAGYIDTNADQLISAVDALLVINALNGIP